MNRDDAITIAFAERLLALLDRRRSFTATYKYAVLLGLLDLCLEHSGRHGEPPSSVTTRQLAEKVIALYWPQSRDYPGRGGILKQNAGRSAKILRHIEEFRSRPGVDPSAPLCWMENPHDPAWSALVRDVEWVLVDMPLPRLQSIGDHHEHLIYSIQWEAGGITRPQFERYEFGNQITFLAGAAAKLVSLSGLLRPILHREWAAKVARLNRLPESELEDFLFGADRRGARRLLAPLREMQDNRCFYCCSTLGTPHVDHFIPWARHPDDGVDNLVVADANCNGSKSDYLASTDHVARWWRRSHERTADLAGIASAAGWEHHSDRSIATTRGIYWNLPEESRLWQVSKQFVPLRLRDLARALGSEETAHSGSLE